MRSCMKVCRSAPVSKHCKVQPFLKLLKSELLLVSKDVGPFALLRHESPLTTMQGMKSSLFHDVLHYNRWGPVIHIDL